MGDNEGCQFESYNSNDHWFGFFETDDSWSSYYLARDWDILIMDALLHVPGNEERHRTFRINISDNLPPSPACPECVRPPSEQSDPNSSSNQ